MMLIHFAGKLFHQPLYKVTDVSRDSRGTAEYPPPSKTCNGRTSWIYLLRVFVCVQADQELVFVVAPRNEAVSCKEIPGV